MNLKRTLFGLWILVLVAAPTSAAEKPSKYPFALPPVDMVDRLAKADVGAIAPFDAVERKFLKELFDLRTAAKPAAVSDDFEVQLHLFASGTTDPAARAKYAERLELIFEDAKTAVTDAKTPQDKADKLLRHLHAGPMKGGYDLNSTTLVELIDTGKFNCVSSSVLYYLVGRRLGLELVPILIDGSYGSAGHATLDLVVDGKRTDVETTNVEGVGLAEKNRKSKSSSAASVPDRKKGRDSTGFGLASSTLGNRSNALQKGDRAAPATVLRLLAVELAYDPTNAIAIQNLKAAFVNWGPKLMDAAKFDEALRMYAVAEAVVPADAKIRNNHSLVWSTYIVAEIVAGRDEAAVALVTKARKAFPLSKDFKTASAWFVEAAYKVKNYEAKRAVLDRGIEVVPEAEAKALTAAKIQTYRQESQDLLRANDYAGSLKALAAGSAAHPNDKSLQDGVAFHAQESLRGLAKTKGRKPAAEHADELAQQFPKNDGVVAQCRQHAYQMILGLAKDGKYDDASAALPDYAGFFKEGDDGLAVDLYDTWADKLAKGGKWEEAAKKYLDGIKLCPRSDRLTTNAIAMIDRWAKTKMDVKDWPAAIAIYEAGLEQFPKNGHLLHNKNYCEAQLKK